MENNIGEAVGLLMSATCIVLFLIAAGDSQ